MPKNHDLSVSIVTHKSDPSILRRTLTGLDEAVQQAMDRALIDSCEIRIIDNAGELNQIEKTLHLLQPSSRSDFVISSAENRGFGAGHNLAIKETDSKHHLILNPDAILSKDALLVALEHFEANPGISLICPTAIDEHTNATFLCKRYPSVFDLLVRGFLPRFLQRQFSARLTRYEYRDLAADKPSEVLLASGCCMLLDTIMLRDIGGFDERYFLYFEDFDLSLRISKLGAIVYLPSMKVIHLGGDAAEKGLRHIFMFIQSAIRFFNRWGWKFT